MNLIIFGSDDFDDYRELQAYAYAVHDVYGVSRVLCDTQGGTARMAEQWAREMKLPIRYYPVDVTLGADARKERDGLLAEDGDYLLAFLSINSPATLDLVGEFWGTGKPVSVVYVV